jgi:phosphate transport system permease protein
VISGKKDGSYLYRRGVDTLVRCLCFGAVILAVLPLVSVLGYVIAKGASGLSLHFFTDLPKPVGEPGGGMAHALVGTITLVGIASAIGIPAGVLAGVYLSEFGSTKLARIVRFSADVLAGVPSIVVGVFVYTILVLWMRRFSAWAGGLALAILMLPTVVRTTEEMLKLVPSQLREAGLALGLPKWRTTLFIVLRTAAPGIGTGVMLAVARVAGETAPLLFTAFGNRTWPDGLDQPIAALPVQIYTYAVSPYDDWHKQAWAAALVLVLFVLSLNLIARVVLRTKTSRA